MDFPISASSPVTYTTPSDLIPVGWTADAVFGGISGLLGNTTVLAGVVLIIALSLAPKVLRTFKRMVGRN